MAKRRGRKSGFSVSGCGSSLVALMILGIIGWAIEFIENYTWVFVTIFVVVVVVAILLWIRSRTSPMGTIDQVDNMDGHDFEYWCAALLRRTGYSNVVVTRGSGDQGVDITAYKDGIKYAFQCKRYSSKLSNKPVQEVYAGKAMYGCQVGVVMTNNYFTDGAKQLARQTNVLLWDRNTLKWMLASVHPEKKATVQALPLEEENAEINVEVEEAENKGLVDEKVLTTYQGELIESAIDVVVEAGQAQTSLLQRNLRLGYARSARVMDELEDLGIVGRADGAKPRQVFMTKEQWAERKKLFESRATDDISDDELTERAIEAVVEAGQASISYLQRKLRLGYARSARIMDELEALGIVSPADGVKPRQVLMTREQWIEQRDILIRQYKEKTFKSKESEEAKQRKESTDDIIEKIISQQANVDNENKTKLLIPLGRNADGEIVTDDILQMKHILVVGNAGSGKSAFMNSMVMNIVSTVSPDEVKLILVDPKQVDFPVYNGIPHLLLPVITDAKRSVGALVQAVNEMLKRYVIFSDNDVCSLEGYNEISDKIEGSHRIPRIIIVVNELADLMAAVPNDVKDSLYRLLKFAHYVGIHLVVATQYPREDVVTNKIKANIPTKAVFKVSSQTESKRLLGEDGAESLSGNGDFLYKSTGQTEPVKIQGSSVTTDEIQQLVERLKSSDYQMT